MMNVQRCRFRTDDATQVAGVDSLFSYDYMGSAEYEFGALGQSLRRIVGAIYEFDFFDTGLRCHGGGSIFVFCEKAKSEDVLRSVVEIASGKVRTRDGSHLPEVVSGKDPKFYRAEAWWNIDDDWIAFRGEKRKELIRIAVEAVARKWGARPAA